MNEKKVRILELKLKIMYGVECSVDDLGLVIVFFCLFFKVRLVVVIVGVFIVVVVVF